MNRNYRVIINWTSPMTTTTEPMTLTEALEVYEKHRGNEQVIWVSKVMIQERTEKGGWSDYIITPEPW